MSVTRLFYFCMMLQTLGCKNLISQAYRCVLSSILLLVPSCSIVTITVWVGFPISIPTLRQSLFYCKLWALRGFWEAGTWLFPGSFSPELENKRERKGVTQRDCIGEQGYMWIHACRCTHSHKDMDTYCILAKNYIFWAYIHFHTIIWCKLERWQEISFF